MKASIALKMFRDYQKSNLKPSTIVGCRYLTNSFEELFGDKDLNSISSEDTFHFLEIITGLAINKYAVILVLFSRFRK